MTRPTGCVPVRNAPNGHEGVKERKGDGGQFEKRPPSPFLNRIMSSSKTVKKAIAATYLLIYVGCIFWAMSSSAGASGGMAFVLPVILGVPWSLVLGLLLLVTPLPKIVTLVLLLVVPPVINVYLILGIRGVFRLKQGLNQSDAAKGSDTNDEGMR